MVATMASFRTNLDELERRSNELDHLMSDPSVATDPERLMELGRERADLEDVVSAWREYRETEAAIEGALAEGGTPVEVPVPLVAGRCYRLVAAAETTVSDLDVELRSERDIPLASDDDDLPIAVLHREGTVCPTAAGEARAVFRAGAGRGRFAAEVWSRPATAADHEDGATGAGDPPRFD